MKSFFTKRKVNRLLSAFLTLAMMLSLMAGLTIVSDAVAVNPAKVYTVYDENNVVIGNYNTLLTSSQTVPNNGTIRMNIDAVATHGFASIGFHTNLAGKTITIDMQGHNMIITTASTSAIYMSQDANVTITNSASTGGVISSTATPINQTAGTLTLDNVTINQTVSHSAGTLNINNSVITCTNNDTIALSGGTLNLNDSEIKVSYGNCDCVYQTGGTVNAYGTKFNVTSAGKSGVFCDEGSIGTISGCTFTTNTTNNNTKGYYQGGIIVDVDKTADLIENCTINTTTTGAGGGNVGIYCLGTITQLNNCTVNAASAPSGKRCIGLFINEGTVTSLSGGTYTHGSTIDSVHCGLTVSGTLTLMKDDAHVTNLRVDPGYSASIESGTFTQSYNNGEWAADVTGYIASGSTCAQSGNVYTVSKVTSIPVTGVTISNATLTLNKGATYQLSKTVQPTTATNQNVTWASDAQSVATVNQSGLVSAVGAGVAHISVTTQDGNFSKSCTVTVPSNGPFTYNGTRYETLEAVTGAVANGGTITMNADYNTSNTNYIQTTNTFTLDMAGHDITTTVGNAVALTQAANVTITSSAAGSEITSTTNESMYFSAGTLSMNNVKVNVSALNYPALRVNGARLESVTNCTFNVTGFGKTGIHLDSGSIGTISNSTFTTETNYNGANSLSHAGCLLVDGGCTVTTLQDCTFTAESKVGACVAVNCLGNIGSIIDCDASATSASGSLSIGLYLNDDDVGNLPVINTVRGGDYLANHTDTNLGRGITVAGTLTNHLAIDTCVNFKFDKGTATIASGSYDQQCPGWADQVTNRIAADSTYTQDGTTYIVSSIVYASGVTVTPSTLALTPGQTTTLSKTITPDNASNKNVTWSSNQPTIASVDASTGIVTAHANGTAVITATASDGHGATGSCTVTVTTPVQSISLDKDTLALNVGGTYQLQKTFNPTTASNQNVTWSSNHPEIARVENGLVTAVANGTATITVTTADGSKTDTCTVTVTTPVQGISLDKDTLALNVGGTYQLQKTFNPTTASNQNVTWSSNHPEIARVEGGLVTAVSNGTATITVTTADGGKTDTCTVTVTTPVQGIALDTHSATLRVTKTLQLNAIFNPTTASNQNVTWSSNHPEIARVEGGLVTAVANGTATITVTTADGSKTDTCTITVSTPVAYVTLDKETISLTPAESVTLVATITPTNASNTALLWSSDNNGVATVDNGIVTAVGGGTATITVTTVDGSFTDTCLVTVDTTARDNALAALQASVTQYQVQYNKITTSLNTTVVGFLTTALEESTALLNAANPSTVELTAANRNLVRRYNNVVLAGILIDSNLFTQATKLYNQYNSNSELFTAASFAVVTQRYNAIAVAWNLADTDESDAATLLAELNSAIDGLGLNVVNVAEWQNQGRRGDTSSTPENPMTPIEAIELAAETKAYVLGSYVNTALVESGGDPFIVNFKHNYIAYKDKITLAANTGSQVYGDYVECLNRYLAAETEELSYWVVYDQLRWELENKWKAMRAEFNIGLFFQSYMNNWAKNLSEDDYTAESIAQVRAKVASYNSGSGYSSVYVNGNDARCRQVQSEIEAMLVTK